MSAELDKFITDLHDSLAKVLGEDTKHITQDDLGKEDSPTDDMLVVDLKDGHKRVVVDAEEAMALTRELEGVRGGRPIPFGVVGKAQDGSWWVLALVHDVDGKKEVTALCDTSVEGGFRHIAELADMRGNRRVVFDEVARTGALPLHTDAMSLMAIFGKDPDLERTGSLRWVQMTQDKLGTLFEKKERALCLPNALSLQDSLDRYAIQPFTPLSSLAEISKCRTNDPVIREVLERIARDTSYNGIVPWPRLSGIKYVYASAYEQCVGVFPGNETYEEEVAVKLALRLLASMPELMANLPKDHVARRILSRPETQVDDRDLRAFKNIVGSNSGLDATLTALLKMAGAHPAELGTIALTTWRHPSKPDVLLKCGLENMEKLTGSIKSDELQLDVQPEDNRERYFQTYLDQVFRSRRVLGVSRYVRVDMPSDDLFKATARDFSKEGDNESQARNSPIQERARSTWKEHTIVQSFPTVEGPNRGSHGTTSPSLSNPLTAGIDTQTPYTTSDATSPVPMDDAARLQMQQDLISWQQMLINVVQHEEDLPIQDDLVKQQAEWREQVLELEQWQRTNTKLYHEIGGKAQDPLLHMWEYRLRFLSAWQDKLVELRAQWEQACGTEGTSWQGPGLQEWHKEMINWTDRQHQQLGAWQGWTQHVSEEFARYRGRRGSQPVQTEQVDEFGMPLGPANVALAPAVESPGDDSTASNPTIPRLHVITMENQQLWPGLSLPLRPSLGPAALLPGTSAPGSATSIHTNQVSLTASTRSPESPSSIIITNPNQGHSATLLSHVAGTSVSGLSTSPSPPALSAESDAPPYAPSSNLSASKQERSVAHGDSAAAQVVHSLPPTSASTHPHASHLGDVQQQLRENYEELATMQNDLLGYQPPRTQDQFLQRQQQVWKNQLVGLAQWSEEQSRKMQDVDIWQQVWGRQLDQFGNWRQILESVDRKLRDQVHGVQDKELPEQIKWLQQWPNYQKEDWTYYLYLLQSEQQALHATAADGADLGQGTLAAPNAPAPPVLRESAEDFDPATLSNDKADNASRPIAQQGGAAGNVDKILKIMQDILSSVASYSRPAPRYKACIVVAHGKGLPYMLTWTKNKWSDPKGKQTITLRESQALSDACKTQNTLTVIFRLDPGQCVELDSQRV